MQRILIVILLIVILLLSACGDTSTPEPSLEPIEQTTPTSTRYQWQSILIMRDLTGGTTLGVYIDMGQELSPEEIENLKKNVKLVDEAGQEFLPFNHMPLIDFTLTLVDNGEISYSWYTDMGSCLSFDVESESSSYTLYWYDLPPLEVGNPFQSFFCSDLE